jgi:hypothetical protein
LIIAPHLALLPAVKWGLSLAFLGTFFVGLKTGIIDIKTSPNSGIKLSAQNAILAAGAGLLIPGLVFGLLIGQANALAGLQIGVICGLASGLLYGGLDVIQHYAGRFIFCRNGEMPLRYARFLDHAARLVFLQKVGGGYIFIHRLLLEHFAAMRTGEKGLLERGKANTTLQTAPSR